MFVQVMEGRVSDVEGLRAQVDKWRAELAPGATGYLGSTAGAGGSDDAGFVQVIKGRADRAALAPVAAETDELLSRTRPDVLGGIVAWPGDGTFIQTVYFSSEAEARANEKAEPATEEERQ